MVAFARLEQRRLKREENQARHMAGLILLYLNVILFIKHKNIADKKVLSEKKMYV